MQDHGAEGGAAHAAVGNPHQVAHSLAQQACRQAHVAHLRHAGVALGAHVLEHQDAVLVRLEVRAVDAGVVVVNVLEDNGHTGVLQQVGGGRGRLDDGTVRAQVAAQHGQSGLRLHGCVGRADDLRVVADGTGHVLAQRSARDGRGVHVQHVPEGLDHGWQTASVVEVLHQVFARRQQVDQQRHAAAQPVEVVHVQRNAQAAGDGQQVDHEVGGTADGRVDPNGVLKALPLQHLGQFQVLMDHFHDAVAGHVGQPLAPGIDGGNGGVGGQGQPQGLHHAGHGGGGAHGHAVPFAARLAGLRLHVLFQAHGPGAQVVGEAVRVGAGSDVLVAPFAVQHRSAGHDQGRQIHTAGTHDRGRGGLVAACQQDHAVQRVGPEGFLDIHAGQIAEQHGGGPHQGLAQGHDRKLERKAAGLVDTLLDLFRQDAEVAVAGGQFRPGVADADDRPAVEQVFGMALVLHPAAVGESHQVVATEPLVAAQLCFRHGVPRVVTFERQANRRSPTPKRCRTGLVAR